QVLAGVIDGAANPEAGVAAVGSIAAGDADATHRAVAACASIPADGEVAEESTIVYAEHAADKIDRAAGRVAAIRTRCPIETVGLVAAQHAVLDGQGATRVEDRASA